MKENFRDRVWERDEKNSPCIKICLLHPEEKLCLGCFRTAKEIQFWNKYSNSERSSILKQLEIRKEKGFKKKARQFWEIERGREREGGRGRGRERER